MVITSVGVVVAMLIISPPLTMLALFAITPLLVALILLLRRVEALVRRQQSDLTAANTLAGDAITGLRVVRSLGGTAELKERYEVRSLAAFRASLRTGRSNAASSAVGSAMPGVLMGVIGWAGGRLVLEGQFSTADLITFFGWSIFLIRPLLGIEEFGRRFAIAHAGARRIAAGVGLPAAISPALATSETVTPGLETAPLTLGDITVSANGRPVIAGFDLRIEPCRLTVVVANHLETEALSSVIGRVMEPQCGRVMLGHVDIGNLPVSDLRRLVVLAEHDAVLFRGSLRRNLLIGDFRASEEDMRAALHTSAADDILEALPDGLDGVVSERGRSLSGGQRQRVAMARALLADPPILIMVDPTSAVDAFTEAAMVERFCKARKGKTTVVFSSSPAVIAAADEVVFVDDGRIRGHGSHIDLTRSVPVYQAMFAGQ